MRIRLATIEDAARILAIYAPYCTDSSVSFEYQPPDLEEMRKRVTAHEKHPFLVATETIDSEEIVTGYAYASPHRLRDAYRWSVETSVYIDADRKRTGLGRALYERLLAMVKKQGYCNAYAGITLPNPASVAFHESMGFRHLGVFEKVGFKHGAWHDVGWWQLCLATPEQPEAILSIEKEVWPGT